MNVKKLGKIKIFGSHFVFGTLRFDVEAPSDTLKNKDWCEGIEGIVEKSKNTPHALSGFSNLLDEWRAKKDGLKKYCIYRGIVYKFDREYNTEEMLLQILELEDKERRGFERLKRRFELSQKEEEVGRERIPEEVRIAVWRRDEGKCVRCGSREKLEYDHIIPVSKGGNNTIRNIELLCESCNRKKHDKIE